MNNLIKNFMQAPRIELKHLDNFFIELSRQSCNLKCKHCYIERNTFGQNKDFLDIKKIKNALKIVKDYNVKLIYLTGGEPTIHPDFNQIMRMCLKISSVCVLTNGQTTNEKKARFLRKIDDESDLQPENALLPIYVRLDGKLIFDSNWQPEKVLSSMVVKLTGSDTLSRQGRLRNALTPREVMPYSTVSVFIWLRYLNHGYLAGFGGYALPILP